MNWEKLTVVILCSMAFACATRTKPAPIEQVTKVPGYLQNNAQEVPRAVNHAAVADNENNTHMAALSSNENNTSQNNTAPASTAATGNNGGSAMAITPASGTKKRHSKHHQAASSTQQSNPDNTAATGAGVNSDLAVGNQWVMPVHHGKVTQYKQLAKGVDIYGTDGQGIYAVNSGKVVYSGNGLKGYGNLIIIKHNETYLSAYAHNKENLVQEGENVTRGQKIATMGDDNDGKAMLHFELRQNGKPINPFSLINQQ